MEISYIEAILECLKKHNFTIGTVKKGQTYGLFLGDHAPERKYEIEFYEVDGAGTLGIKIQWHLGKVVELDGIIVCLVMNSKVFRDYGPLFAAILPVSEDSINFLLVGNMIFPPKTPPEEVATLLFYNAYINYSIRPDIPGVQFFK